MVRQGASQVLLRALAIGPARVRLAGGHVWVDGAPLERGTTPCPDAGSQTPCWTESAGGVTWLPTRAAEGGGDGEREIPAGHVFVLSDRCDRATDGVFSALPIPEIVLRASMVPPTPPER
jgi:hypothetical protein